MNYGIGYMGSKSAIIKQFIGLFPRADNFYDLFGGGFSVTHGMLKHRRKDFKTFHFNEKRKGVCELINKAIDGDFSYEVLKPKFVDRETFNKKKELDAYIKLIYSFGSGGKGYLYNKDVENYKKSMHNAVVFGDFDETAENILGFSSWPERLKGLKTRRLFLSRVASFRFKNSRLNSFNSFNSAFQLMILQHLIAIERLSKLESLKSFRDKICFYNNDYRLVEIKENSVVYCDIPYKNTKKYDLGFDHKEFYKWALAQKFPLFISEYNLDLDGFSKVMSIRKYVKIHVKEKSLYSNEGIYANKYALDKILNRGKTS